MKNNQSMDHADYDDISFSKIFQTLSKYWILIILCVFIGALFGYGYRKFFVKELYRADASCFVADTMSISEIKIGSELANDYIYILQNKDTLNEVIHELNLDMDYVELSGIVSVSLNKDSHIIIVSATTTDANLSKAIANALIIVGQRRINEIISGSDITIISYAEDNAILVDTTATWKYLLRGIGIGLIVACFIIIILSFQDKSLSDEKNIIATMKLPIFASIPKIEKKDIIDGELSFLECEAFNTLCTNINFSGFGIKSIAFISAGPNEGKSTISYKTAEMITEYGKKVLFLDADMHKSTFKKRFNIKDNYIGLSNFLSMDIRIEDVIIKTQNPNLDLIFSGFCPPIQKM